MTEAEFRTIYPLMLRWLRQTLDEYAHSSRPVNSLGFKRLPRFYRAETLAKAKVAPVSKIPVPPLSALGLARFASFERMPMAGITYLDTFFVLSDHTDDESLHFHELVHIIQWRILGPERFLWLYADGLERFDYLQSPLEAMAFDLQGRFDARSDSFDAEAEVDKRLPITIGLRWQTPFADTSNPTPPLT